MAFKLTILPHMELSLLTYSGAVSQADFDAAWAALAAAGNYHLHFDGLVILGPDADYSGIDYEASIEQSKKFVRANREQPLEKPKRTAFVCATNVQVLMARMFIAFVEVHDSTQHQVECFRCLPPALAWIEASKGPDRVLDRAEIWRTVEAMGQAWCIGNEAAA